MGTTTIITQSIYVPDLNAYQLDSDDNLVVNEGVSVSAKSPYEGIIAIENNRIILNGTASGGTGIFSFDGLRLTIGESGRASGDGVGVELQSGGFINNNGTIVGVQSALYLGDSSAIVNTGRIISVGGNGAINAQVSGADQRLNNSGFIKGPGDYGYSYASLNNSIDHINNTGTMIGEILLGSGNDAYNGRSGHVRGLLDGGSGHDWLEGGTEANRISGGEGLDRLFGGDGNDTFIFNTSLNSKTNREHIKDFSNVKGNNDHFELSSTEFNTFTQLHPGQLLQEEFTLITSPKETVDADARILYDKAHGALYYDADGGGASHRVEFAVLDNHASLTFRDFLVV